MSIDSVWIGIFTWMKNTDDYYPYICIDEGIDKLRLSLSWPSLYQFNDRTNAFLTDLINWIFSCIVKHWKWSALEALFDTKCWRDRSLLSLSQFFCSLTSNAQRSPGEQKLSFSDDFSSYLAILTFSEKSFWGWGSHDVCLVVVLPNEILKLQGLKAKWAESLKKGEKNDN